MTDKSQADDTYQASKSEIVKGGVSSFTTRFIGMGLNYLLAILISRGYGDTGAGIYNICQSVLNFFASIAKLGSDNLMVRFTAQYVAQNKFGWIKDLFNKSVIVSVPLAIFLSAALYFLAPFISESVFRKPGLELYFRISSIALLPLTIFAITTGALRGLKKIKWYTFLHNVSNFLFGILILSTFLLITDEHYAVVVTYVIFVSITCLLSIFVFLKYSKYGATWVEEGLNFNEKFLIGFSLFIASFASLIRGYADTFILARYASEIGEVGVYRNAFKVAIITRISLTAFLIPAAPRFAELFSQGKMNELARSAQFVTRMIFWTSAPILIGIMILAPFIMSIFGEEFRSGSTALMILAAGQFVNAATGPVSNILIMTGKQRVNRDLMVGTTVIAIALDFWLIPIYGAVGAAWVNTIGVCLMNLIPFFLVKYYYGFYTLNLRELFAVHPRKFLDEIRQALKKEKKKKGEGNGDYQSPDDDSMNSPE